MRPIYFVVTEAVDNAYNYLVSKILDVKEIDLDNEDELREALHHYGALSANSYRITYMLIEREPKNPFKDFKEKSVILNEMTNSYYTKPDGLVEKGENLFSDFKNGSIFIADNVIQPVEEDKENLPEPDYLDSGNW